MNTDEFREFGKAAVDFIADYLENVRNFDVLPEVSPGYLSELLPSQMPEKPEDWKSIMEDIKRTIIPGLTHWQSPNFHAYFPTETSYPSIIGEMMAAGFGVLGFTWLTSPVCTELEVIVMDWLGRFLNLPNQFLSSSGGPGGGIIQGSASEAILVALLSAREQVVKKYKANHPKVPESEIRGNLVAYSSDQSNSCVERAGLIATVPVKLIPTNDDFVLTGIGLEEAIEEDLQQGRIPVIFIATTGSTGTCAYDDLKSLGPVCKKYNLWLHVDAAYGAVGFCLPEYKHLLEGVEYADSLKFNLNKSIRVNFDCTAMWLQNPEVVVDSLVVDRIYLKHNYQRQNSKAPDYRHWQIPLGRRFRALKVWMVMKSYGADGIRKHVQNSFSLTELFEKYVFNDRRFEIIAKRTLGLVCFRIKGENNLTKALLNLVTQRRKIYIIEAEHKETIFLRFAVCGMDPKPSDIDFAWNEISTQADVVLIQYGNNLKNNSL